MTGANGVTVSGSGKDITVTGTSYSIAGYAPPNQNQAIIGLFSKENASVTEATPAGSFTIYGGNNIQILGGYESFTLAATDTHLSSNSLTIANNSSAGFDITVKDTGNNQDTETLDPKITLGTHTAAADQISFVNGVANLPVYTKDEIDSQNKALNALEYKGTVGTDGSAASSISQLISSQAETLKIG